MITVRPYPAYKESGIDWLGNMPEHWDSRRLKRLASINPPKSEVISVSEDQEVTFLPMERVSSHGQIDPSLRRRLSDVRSGFTYFRNGDVIVAKITPCFENGKSALVTGLETGIGFGSTEFHVLRPSRKLESRYLYRLMSSHDFLNLGEQSMEGAGGQKRVPTDFVAGFETPLPPLSEQRAIADFLDGMDARITRFLAARRRMIALLEEQKQAVINHAVTRGLDPDVPLKDSGVDWLGEIPAHWEITRLGALTSYVSYGFTNPMPSTDNGPYMVTAADIADGKVQYSSARRTSQDAFDRLLTAKSRPQSGDLLITKDGTLGRTAIAPAIPFCINQSVALLRIGSSSTTPQFLNLLLNAARYQNRLLFEAGGSTIKHIYISRLVKMAISLPPKEEQLHILDASGAEISRIDILIDSHRREIDLMQEYRTRLISDVVTGKLDVRGVELPPVEAIIGEEIEAAMEEQPIPL